MTQHAITCLLLAACLGCAATNEAPKPAAKPNLGKLRHVVLFKFKDGTTPEQIKAIEEGFRQLPSKVPQVIDFEWGRDVSTENLAKGYTHCFLVTFENAAARDVYLPHPEHKAFVELLQPHLDEVLVVDYVAGQ